MQFFGWKPTLTPKRAGLSPLDTTASSAFERTHAPTVLPVAGNGGIQIARPLGTTSKALIIAQKGVTLADVRGFGLDNSYNAGRGLYGLADDQSGKASAF